MWYYLYISYYACPEKSDYMAKKTNKKKKINKKIVSKNNGKLKTSQSAQKKDTLEKNKHYLSNNNLGTNKINSQKSKVVSKPDNKWKNSKKALKKILKPKKSFICLLFIILGITLFIVLNNMKYNKKDLEKFIAETLNWSEIPIDVELDLNKEDL